MSTREKLDQLSYLKTQAELGGGQPRIDVQHEAGKLTARERLDLLLDDGSFEEIDKLVTHKNGETSLAESVVVGFGKIDGRLVYIYAQDFTVSGGSLSEASGKKIIKVMDLAVKNGSPIIGINDGGSARVQEGVDSLATYGEIFKRNVNASGVVPQISVVMGPCAGGAVYSPILTDFIFMTDKAYMYITGPDVVQTVTGEQVTHESLGGAAIHSVRSGVCHFEIKGEKECLEEVRKLLSFFPSNNMETVQVFETTDQPDRSVEDLVNLIPNDTRKAYDMKEILYRVVDDGDFMEVEEQFAQNIIIGFARMSGITIGIVANQPAYLAGVLDIDSSDKAARFIRTCDAFNIPVITFVDTPGYSPGTAQEYGGIIRHGAKIVYAYSEATVPKITIIIRKAYGGAYVAMASKHLGADVNLAWPTAEIAVMGPDAAVKIINKRQLQKASDPELEQQRLENEYREQFANPYIAASKGYVDDVIDPRETRFKIIRALEMLASKSETKLPKKHGNIPL